MTTIVNLIRMRLSERIGKFVGIIIGGDSRCMETLICEPRIWPFRSLTKDPFFLSYLIRYPFRIPQAVLHAVTVVIIWAVKANHICLENPNDVFRLCAETVVLLRYDEAEARCVSDKVLEAFGIEDENDENGEECDAAASF